MSVLRQDFVDAGEGVEGAGEADVGQADGEGGEQRFLAVAYGGVAAHVGLDLRLTAALRGEDGRGQQLTLRNGEKFAGIEVAEAVGGQILPRRR